MSNAGAADAGSTVSVASAACSASLKTVLATRTVGAKTTFDAPVAINENGVGPFRVNPVTAPMDANKNTKALSRFMLLCCLPLSLRRKVRDLNGWMEDGGRRDGKVGAGPD